MRNRALVLVGGLLVAACAADPPVTVESSAQSVEQRTDDATVATDVPLEPTVSGPASPRPNDEEFSDNGSPDDPGSSSATFEALFARGRSDVDVEYVTPMAPSTTATFAVERLLRHEVSGQPVGETQGPASTIMSMVAAPDGAILSGAQQEWNGTARAAIWNVAVDDTVTTEPIRLLGPDDSASVAEHAVVSNDLTHVVGHVGSPEVATVWTVDVDQTTATTLPGPSGTIARRIAAGDDGTLWVLGEQPGFAGQLLIWSSTDGGVAWSDPYVEPVFQWINPYALTVGEDLAVVSWDALGASEGGRYRLRTFERPNAGEPPTLTTSEALDIYSDELVDVRAENGVLQILEHSDQFTAVWTRTADGRWQEDLRDPGAMPPVAFGRIAGNDAYVQAADVSYDATVQVVTAAEPDEVIAGMTLTSAFYTRFLEFPAVVTRGRLLLLDPGTSDAPVMWSVDSSGATRTELDLAPHRRKLHERVVDLASDGVRTFAVIGAQFESAPGDWASLGERLVVIDPELGEYPAFPSAHKVLVEHTSAGTVVGVANGASTEWHLVGAFDPDSTPQPVGFSDGVATRLVATTHGAMISTIDGRAFVSSDLVDWSEVSAVRDHPGANFFVEDICTSGYLTFGVGTLQSPGGIPQATAMARTGSMWLPVYRSGRNLFEGSTPARCAIGEADLTIVYRQPTGRYRATESVLIDLERLATSPESVGAAMSIPDDFSDRFLDAGVTEIEPMSDGWMAIGGSLDPDGSEDAVLWLGDYQDPDSVVTLATGPGLQEARTLLVTNEAVQVGGTDNGVPTIWTLPLDT